MANHRRLLTTILALPALWAPTLWARAQETQAAAPLPETDFTMALIKMLGGLALVLALMVGAYWLTRRFLPQAGGAGGGRMRLVGRLALGPRKSVALVAVAGRVLVLGVGQDQVNLLTTLDDPQEVEELCAEGGAFWGKLKKASEDLK